MKTIPDITAELTEIGIVQKPNPILFKKATDVTDLSENGQDLEKRMRDALSAVIKLYEFNNGIGLAAPQIGVSKRAILFGIKPSELLFVLNPHITYRSRKQETAYEGCLSFWSVRGRVSRATKIRLKGMDAQGSKLSLSLEGTLARMAQHEIDHLDGKLYIERMESCENLLDLSEYALEKESLSQRNPTFRERKESA